MSIQYTYQPAAGPSAQSFIVLTTDQSADFTVVPIDPANSAYADYLAWVALGNASVVPE